MNESAMLFRLLLVSLFLLAPGTRADESGGHLLAPPYPGSVHEPAFDTFWLETWLSQDPPEAVRAWYAEQLGQAPTQTPGRGDFFLLLSYEDAVRVLKAARRNWTLAIGDSGVEVHEHAYASIRFEPCLSDHFSDLRLLVAQGIGEQATFDRLCRDYAWIERAYYRVHDPENLRQPIDKYLLAETQARLRGGQQSAGQSAEELAERAQALSQAGQYSEANKLIAQIVEAQRASATPPADAWERWVEHLETVAANAYRTKIVINTRPLEWHRPDSPGRGQ